MFEVDLEAFESVRAERHPVAVRDDRDRLPAVRSRSAHFRLKRAAHPRQHERREIVEIGRAEAELAIRQPVGADRDGAREARRGQCQREIVDPPAAVGGLRDMGRALQLVAVDVARRRGVASTCTGDVDRIGLEGDAGRLAVEQTAGAQGRFQPRR